MKGKQKIITFRVSEEEWKQLTEKANAYELLFVKLFTPKFCTLFTTIFILLSNVSSHYITLIMHIKYSNKKMKHIILPECHLCDIRVFLCPKLLLPASNLRMRF